MKITGEVSDGFKTHLIHWTVTADGIESHGGLDTSRLTVSGHLPALVEAVEEPTIDDDYDDKTVAELRVILGQRDEPIYGNKSDLIARLRAWDASNPDGYVAEETVVEDSGESEEAAVVDESEGEVVE